MQQGNVFYLEVTRPRQLQCPQVTRMPSGEAPERAVHSQAILDVSQCRRMA